ncbi:MAG: ATP-dependent DNA helicase [Clostridiales bacterium]|nr:ATP-dependent DNA helicase [Candidatus Blautia equi]
MEKAIYRISVRHLVEFLLKSGDLDNRGGGGRDKDAMQKGSRIHRKIQKQMGSTYQAEAALKRESEYEDLTLLVEGRADGILMDDGEIVIDEIKGVYADVTLMEGPVPVHLAQAKCYAFIYGERLHLEQIQVQLTYANLDTEVIRRFRETFSMEELRVWYEDLTLQYHKWISYQQKWRQERNASMQQLNFPFPYREGQKKMVSSVYHTVTQGKQIFIQAPTGVGKTMSTIFPAVRAMGEGKGEIIFYLTAKTITRTVAEEAFDILKQNGLKFQVVTLTAKDKLCVCESGECNPDACPRARGHLDRVNGAVFELWTTQQIYNRDAIEAQAEKWQVCPFEMSLDLALWVDGVICDYNYVFDPNVHLKRFFAEGVKGDYIFLIDEAHNLVERGREMYSASICKEDVLEVKRLVKNSAPKLAKSLDKVNKQLLELKKDCGEYQILDNAGALSLSLLQTMGEMEKIMEERKQPEVVEDFLDFYFMVRDFVNISELVDENYVVYSEHRSDGSFAVKLSCINPANNLSYYLKKGVSAVFFSATLLPLQYYGKLLSTETDDYGIYVPSPFARERRKILIGTDVSSRYTRRGYEEYRRIAEYIARAVWQRKGNYMVFFPSYKMLEDVYDIYEQEFSVNWVRTMRQQPSMSEQEREFFLSEFRSQKDTLVGFCIMGGIFSEGIDLIGDRLIGVLIVGTGLPQVGNEREILKNYYDKNGENGFDYAYRFPGMNKVQQAAGRVIRTREDVGVILLLDDRFGQREYKNLFPVEWSDAMQTSIRRVEQELKGFWDGFPPEEEPQNGENKENA